MGKERIKKQHRLLIVCLAMAFLFGSVIASPLNAQISGADPYRTINWKCIKANPALRFKVDSTYPGEAYWYSGNDSIPFFKTKVSSTAYIPGGYKDAINATDRAGIDCSAFVGRIWGFGDSKYGTSTLPNVSRKIYKSVLQTNDILNRVDDHVVLFEEWDSNPDYMWIYHAKGSGDPNYTKNPGNMVVREKVSYSDYSETKGFTPRRKGILAPVSCSMVNNATDVQLKPTIMVQLNGPARPESVNNSTVVLKKYSNGLPIDGILTYDKDTWQITFTPLSNLEKETKYIYKVKPEIMDLEFRGLDTDLDAKAGGQNLEKIFTTKDTSGILDLVSWVWTSFSGSSGGMAAMSVKTAGAGDNIIDPGEKFQLTLTLNNTGTQAATYVSGTLSSTSGINITNGTQSFGSILPGSSGSNINNFVFEVPSSYSANEIEFKLKVTGWIGSDPYSDEYTFKLPVGTYLTGPPGSDVSEILDFGIITFPNSNTPCYKITDDRWGNGNGRFDYGDYEVEIIFYAGNATDTALDASFRLDYQAEQIKLLDDPIKSFIIPPYSYIEVPFKFILATDVNTSKSIAFVLTMDVLDQKKSKPLAIHYYGSDTLGTKIYLDPVDPSDVFSPNGDGFRDELKIPFTNLTTIPKYLGGWDLLYQVRKQNDDGTWGDWQRVKAKLDSGYSVYGQPINAGKKGVLTWKNEENLESGFYEVKIDIWSFVADDLQVWQEWYHSNTRYIHLHKTSPRAEGLDWTTNFSAFNPGLPGSATLLYDLTLAADTTIEVRNANNEIIYKLADAKLSPKGRKEYVFQNYDSDDNILPDGKYTFNIQLDDHANMPVSYVKVFMIDHAPQDFYLVTPTNEVISSAQEYFLSWTPASLHGPAWNHLKEYQVLGRKIDGAGGGFGVLENHISSEATSTSVGLPIEGIWEIKVRAVDEEGNWCDSDGANSVGYGKDPNRILIVKIDTEPPKIEAIAVSNKYFSPNGDGKKDNTELTFNLSDNYADKMFVTVQVRNEYGELIEKIIEREELSAGQQCVTWEGVSIPDGNYELKIYAEDKVGNLGTIAPVEVVLDTAPPEIIELAAEPNPFTPNADGIKDTTVFNFKLSEPCFANLEIYREDGELFTQRGLYNVNEGSMIWDGRGARGEILGGEYTYLLSAEDLAGNIASSETQIIVVDRGPSLVPYVFAEPDPFSAVNQNGHTNIRYYISRDDVQVSVEVLGREGTVIKNLLIDNLKHKGEHAVAWYGDYESDYTGPVSSRDQSKVPDGAYEFKVTAYDPYNEVNEDNSNTVLVDNTPPYLSIYPVDVDLENKTVTFGYFLPESASVEVTVYEKDGLLLGELMAKEYTDFGEHYVSWDMGATSPGQKYFKVIAEDSAKNRDEKTTQLFSISTGNELAISNLFADPDPFTPNGDGHTDYIKIAYQIAGGVPDYAVNIDIVNETGATLRTLVENDPQSSGSYFFYWDGKDDAGQWTLDGNYEYVISAEDKLGMTIEERGTLLAVSTRPTVYISSNLPVFSPNGDDSKDAITFNYSIDYSVQYITGEALFKLEVLNTTAEAVWSKIFNHTAGSYAYEYNGSTDTGLETLDAGQYYVRANAQDALGSMAIPKTISFMVDYENPVVTISEISPNPFSPDVNGINDETAIAYTVSKDSDVTVQVKDQAGTLVKELVSSERISASSIKALALPTVIWDGKDASGSMVADATYEVYVSAEDDAGNRGQAVAAVVVDNNTEYSSEFPPIRNIDIDPAYAKEGSTVTIDFSVAEELLSQPVVKVGSYSAIYVGSEIVSSTRRDYHYSYIVADDPEGSTSVYIEITDLAGNVSSSESEIIIDKTDPSVSNLTVNPNPASIPDVSGPVSIKFNVSEALKEAPKVYVTQSGASPQSAIVGGDWTQANGQCEGKYDVFSGNDGPALISIEVIDLAGNTFVDSFPNSLIADTLAPAFSDIQAEISANPEFTNFAREGSEVTIRFKTSEDLEFNPEVKVNGSPAGYDGLIANEYTYTYTVADTDNEGNAAITIAGFDFAGNEGTAETSSSSESFVIDLTDPTVEIAYPGSSEIIASPSPFFTNADPNDTQERPNYTTLRYETSEYGLVTLKVYQVDKNKTADQYTRDDFAGTPVATLISGSWMTGGVHNNVWYGQTSVAGYDTNSDGYADPGKYAFIVEVSDKAGNVTQRLWGGTVWIQNNVLQLEQPGTIGINPDPLNFSPNGNSPITTTKFWFKVKLGISPAAPADPERIEIFALPGDMEWLTGVVKKVGTYTVRVYDSGGSLIRTIEKDSDMYSATDTFVIWEGKVGTGTDLLTPAGFAADGDYRIAVEVKDFAGNLAYCAEGGTTLERWGRIDSTSPAITDNQGGDDTWRNSSGATYNVDFSDTGSKLHYAQYKICTGAGQTGTVLKDWAAGSAIFSGSSPESYTSDWQVDFSKCNEGTNYVSVRVYDIAGNYSEQSDVFYVRKDTKEPINGTISINNTYGGTAGYTKQIGVNLSLSANDQNEPDCSHVTKMKIWNDGSSEPGTYIAYSTSVVWNIRDLEGARTVYVKFGDDAGHWSSTYSAGIIYDRTPPSIPSGLRATTGSGVVNLSWSSVSGADGYNIYRATTYNGSYSKVNSSMVTTNSYQDAGLTNGTRYWYKVKAADNAGNESGFSNYVSATPGNINNTRIVFESARDGDGEVFKMNIDASNQINLTNNGILDKCPNFSPDGAKIIYVANDPIYAMNSDGSNKQMILNTIAYDPCYSPDGSKIAFSQYDSVTGWHVHIMNSNGTGITKLTSSSDFTFNMKPSFSPDGTKIIYQNDAGIWRMNINGSGKELLTYGFGATYSPDGIEITFYRNDYHDGQMYDQIWIMNADGSNARMITEHAHNAGAWSKEANRSSFSPDNKRICFNAQSAGNTEIYRIEADGSGLQRLTTNTVFDAMPAWSPFPGSGVTTLGMTEKAQVQQTGGGTLEIIAPKEGISLQSIRPLFEWYGLSGIQDYRIEARKTGFLLRVLSKKFSSAEVSSARPTLTYSIHEFDEGLEISSGDLDFWYWKVIALDSTGSVTAETDEESFLILPELAISGVTNYPNPFNPGREETTIRYRLSRDADVKIRIYDITGALVRQLEFSAGFDGGSRERPGIWDKYNDVKWDGKNGRGDIVANGIYPFEVIARYGDGSVSGRGKIAVLK